MSGAIHWSPRPKYVANLERCSLSIVPPGLKASGLVVLVNPFSDIQLNAATYSASAEYWAPTDGMNILLAATANADTPARSFFKLIMDKKKYKMRSEYKELPL
jgi:hypothetical protein